MENEVKYYRLKQSKAGTVNILSIMCCSKTNEDWDRSDALAKEIRKYGPLD